MSTLKTYRSQGNQFPIVVINDCHYEPAMDRVTAKTVSALWQAGWKHVKWEDDLLSKPFKAGPAHTKIITSLGRVIIYTLSNSPS